MAGGLAALLFGTAMVSSGGGLVPAAAMEGASLLVAKTVNGKDAERDLRPGDSVTYRVEFRVNDEDADAPVRVVDALPAAFAGWQISGLTAVVGGSPANVTLELPGITSGPSPSGPVGGTLGASSSELAITVGVSQPVQAGAGNASGLGMSTRDTGVLEYTITIPEGLSPDDPILRTDLVNTATFTARAGQTELSTSDSALISVDNPISVDVVPVKTWTPDAQGYEPGRASTVTIGGTQASNVDASRLTLQDPADPALTPDGAKTLHADNPFNYVDFAGFTSPNDPSSQLPAGATAATAEVYRLSDGVWSWAPWTPDIPNERIAGVRLSYTGSIPPTTSVSQSFSVQQRDAHRGSGDRISAGYRIVNDVRATVEVEGQPAVSKDAEAPFETAPEQIDVSAQKRFYALPDGRETENLTGVTAGDTVGVVLRAINEAAPRSTVLERLVIAEPGAGSNPEFFGDHLAFAGFTGDPAAVWPQGAERAEIVWQHPGGPTTDVVNAGEPLPTAPDGVTGFEIAFVGAIAPGAASEVRYELASTVDEEFVAPGATAGPFLNTIDVTGSKTGLPDETANAGASVSYVSPRIDVSIDKRVGPGVVLAGQDVVVQLDTEVTTSGGRTKPTEIVVEDALGGDGTFWDAFDAKQILAPISRPVNNGTPAVQADLTIRYQNAAGDWIDLATNPDEDTPIDVPAGATGLRFVYTNPAGFAQTTYVKPNISFTARDTLRSSEETPTGGGFETPVMYENTATAEATGELGDRVVTGRDEDAEEVGVRGTEHGTGPGPGGLWTSKDWAHSALTSQSGATSWTTHSWAVTRDGYPTVELQDPAAPTATGAGTVFEAFDLTHVRPIRYSGDPGNGTVDPMLRWDLVTDVQLWNGSQWVSVPAPGGGWMNSEGFVGYTLTAEQRSSALGVRLVLTENAAARQAAIDAGDLTSPAVGSGVAASADIRAFRLDWQLRERARTEDGSLKWVKERGTDFNCVLASTGCVDNVFALTAVPPVPGVPVTSEANDTIQVIDGTTNVSLGKQVRPLPLDPDAPAAKSTGLVVPNAGELEQADYPRARYTLTAKNASTRPEGGRGTMKLGKIRVTDPMRVSGAEPTISDSPFEGRDFATEVASPEGNHFDVFDLVGVSFDPLPAYIDTSESSVEIWVDDGTPQGAVQTFSLQQVLDGDAAFTASLPDAIGISVTYSSEDPAHNGNRIAVGDELVMHLDVQLRQTERLSGDPVSGGSAGATKNVPNEAVARGWDAVVAPETQPTDRDDALVELTQAGVRVNLEKQVAVDHGDSSDRTLLEAEPEAPVNVTLTADPNGATAPLNTLTIEDTTPSFWNRFEFIGFGSPTHPLDADAARFEVRVGEAWQEYAGYAGDPADIRGVRITYSRADGALFPLGAASWSASWGIATLPFTVRLRADAPVDWSGDSETNTASVVADNVQYGSASDEADARVDFAPGSHEIQVVKRAPNDTSTHQVEPLASLPWQLVFTNTGTGYLPLTKVTDALPAELVWDGEQLAVTSAPGSTGRVGVTGQPTVGLSDDGRELVFEWPEGTRMEPGETVTIGLGLILQPLPSGQRATNTVVVETGVPLDACVQPTDFGQDPEQPVAENECSNTNFVQPRAGTVIGAVKTVNGEPAETLGEDLVSGALDVRTGEACKPGNYLPVGSGYTRNPCASYTAIGSTDTWRLQHINSGTNPLSRIVIVDMLPIPGDRMLAGGAPRTSTFRPVLADLSGIRVSGLPAGASYRIDVTTDPAACVGSAPGASLWVSDPECADAATNPANVWTPLEDFSGEAWEIAGIRIDVDMAAEPLQPAGDVTVEFETVNRVIEHAPEGLQPTLAQFETPQFAWNQNGVIGWDTAGNRVSLPAAPQRAGVTVKTGMLQISKEVLGEGASNAPDAFPIDLSCTVPSGLVDPERVALDLGEYAHLLVPKDGTVTVPGLPIGADCTARESGDVGAHGESGRSIEAGPGVIPASDGLSAQIRIREEQGGEAQLRLRNTYTLGELTVEKAVTSSTEYAPSAEQLEAEFDFELVCRTNGAESEIRREFRLSAGEQHREAGLPVGAECTLTETSTGGAQSTTVTAAGVETEGASRDRLLVGAEGAHVLVSNVFEGVPPHPGDEPGGDEPGGDEPRDTRADGGLPVTGGSAAALAAGALLLLVGAAMLLARRRNRSA